MNDLKRHLDELRLARRPTPAPCTPGVAIEPLADVLGGAELRGASGPCWLIETGVDVLATGSLFGPQSIRGPRGSAIDARRVMLVDLETGGFSGAPLFLIGLLRLGGVPLRIEQYLVRDYPEEEHVLRAFAEVAAERDAWVTFNGRGFDEPFVRDRAVRHRVPLTPPATHVDVLHLARRRWAGETPDCRLATLERCILGHVRVGDVPGCDIPELFHHFVRTGNARPLRPVLEHNRLDLLATLGLLLRLAGG